MKNSPKSFLKRMTAAVLLAVMLAGVFAAQGCKKKTEQGPAADQQQTPGEVGEALELTDLQKKNILAAAEAFYESGTVYDDQNPISFKTIESFIYYIYNGELEAGENGMGTVALEEAESRIKTLFGIDKLLHTKKRANAVQNYYCEGDTYFIRVNEPAGECTIASAEWAEDGAVKITVTVKDANGPGAALEFMAALKDGDLKLISCKRYDEA